MPGLATTIAQNGATADTLSYISNATNANQQNSIDLLRNIGITKIGHALAVLGYMEKIKNPPALSPPVNAMSTHRPKLPTAKAPSAILNMTPHSFRKFQHDWKSFKGSCNIPADQCRNYLYQCCSRSIRERAVYEGRSWTTSV